MVLIKAKTFGSLFIFSFVVHQVFEGYGQTEVTAAVTMTLPQETAAGKRTQQNGYKFT